MLFSSKFNSIRYVPIIPTTKVNRMKVQEMSPGGMQESSTGNRFLDFARNDNKVTVFR